LTLLNPGLLAHGEAWRLLTYVFVVPDAQGLLFSLLALWLIGASMEQQWGTRRFLTFYVLSAAAAGGLASLVGLVSPAVRGAVWTGNFAAIAAIVAAYAVTRPNDTILLGFVLPVSGKVLLAVSVGITLLFMVMRSWVAYLPELLAFPAGIFLVNVRTPSDVLLRARVWWIDRRLRRSKLRVVRGSRDDEPFGGAGRGSDKYLH
jgi:membrane associated rhomboid family serine protease